MGKPCRRTITQLIFKKENKDTPEITVENFSELLKNGDKPKKYIKEIEIPLEEVGDRMFFKKIFAKRIFLNPFKTQFEIKALRRTGKTTACVKFAKRMIKKNKTVIWIIHCNLCEGIIRAYLPMKYFSKIVFYTEEGTERYLTDIIHSRQLYGRVKTEDKIAFIIDELQLLGKGTIPDIIRKFCKQNDTPYIFTQTPFWYLQEKGSDYGTVEVIYSNDIRKRR